MSLKLNVPLTILAALFAAPALSETQDDAIANLSLEQLADIRITSVSRKAERLVDTAAAVTVIQGEDIRRSGATTLPEALRLAPNLAVARVDARNYAISARGFNNAFANKMLVLIDGRTVYSPLFSGVFWDAQDVVLADIERIEVISGPGATVWGSNAVNGVINIITRPARDTEGGLASAGLGERQRDATVRYGMPLAGGSVRAYAKFIEDQDAFRLNGQPTLTGWRRHQAGFRFDSGEPGRSFTLQGDAYSGRLAQAATTDIAIGGANLLARVTRKLDGGSELRLQVYLDRTERDQPTAFREVLNTFDLDVQHSLHLGASNNLVWGGGHRDARSDVTNSTSFAFLPPLLDQRWSNLFVQDEWSITPDLMLTAGLKAERNHYTGAEKMPQAALSWHLSPQTMLWASWARAARVPSRTDRDLYFPVAPPVVKGVPQYVLAGGPDFQSEIARVSQLGARGQPQTNLSWSATAWYGHYDGLRSTETNTKGPGFVAMNRIFGDTSGIELSGNWDVTRNWRLAAGHVNQRVRTYAEEGSRDTATARNLGLMDPGHYSSLRSFHRLSDALELDVTVRKVGEVTAQVVPGYTAVDIRLGWHLRRDLELSLLAKDVGAPEHPEYGAGDKRAVYPSTAYVRLTWTF